jgi:hypothetical protein
VKGPFNSRSIYGPSDIRFSSPTTIKESQGEAYLTLVHPFSMLTQPHPHFIDLDHPSVVLIETLKRGYKFCLCIKIEQALAHHREEHCKVDAAVAG